MSKLPMESRPLRLAPEVARVVEKALAPLEGETLEAARAAILKVYQSGQQMTSEQWCLAYDEAIASAVTLHEQSVASVPRGGKRVAA
jgi:hypothetical protein